MASIKVNISKHAAQMFTRSMTTLDVDAIRSEGRICEVLRLLVDEAKRCASADRGTIPLPLGKMEVIARQRHGECKGCQWHPDVCSKCVNGH